MGWSCPVYWTAAAVHVILGIRPRRSPDFAVVAELVEVAVSQSLVACQNLRLQSDELTSGPFGRVLDTRTNVSVPG
jgi:hypothetical protein